MGIAVSQVILFEVMQELSKAAKKFPPFKSEHEGYAILFEEVDELWDAIKNTRTKNHDVYVRGEAIQVAAMALRFLIDICYREQAIKEANGEKV